MKFPAASNGISLIILQISLQATENALKGIHQDYSPWIHKQVHYLSAQHTE
jgi:hypothetical protein